MKKLLVAALLVVVCGQLFAATAVPILGLALGVLDNNGQPLAGGVVHFYIAGSNTPQNIYSDSSESNPTATAVLDGYGRTQVYADGQYKIVINDANDSATIYTIDSCSFVAPNSSTNLSATNITITGQAIIASASINMGYIASTVIDSANIQHSIISNATISNSVLSNNNYANGTYTNPVIENASISYSDISTSTMEYSTVSSSTLQSVHLYDSTFAGGEIQGATTSYLVESYNLIGSSTIGTSSIIYSTIYANNLQYATDPVSATQVANKEYVDAGVATVTSSIAVIASAIQGVPSSIASIDIRAFNAIYLTTTNYMLNLSSASQKITQTIFTAPFSGWYFVRSDILSIINTATPSHSFTIRYILNIDSPISANIDDKSSFIPATAYTAGFDVGGNSTTVSGMVELASGTSYTLAAYGLIDYANGGAGSNVIATPESWQVVLMRP